MAGFFSGSSLADKRKPLPLIAQCGACGIHKTCRTPFMKVAGHGNTKRMIVGELPSEKDDKRGKPFSGDYGDNIKNRIRKLTGEFSFNDFYWTNSLICHPKEKTTVKNVTYCQPNLLKAIKELKPKVIILLGHYAVKSVIGYLWKDSVGEIDRWVGWQIPSQEFNAWICPTWHPTHMIRRNDKAMNLISDQHLKKALALKGRPWKEVPDYRSQVRTTLDDWEACLVINRMMKRKRPVAFDYETNMLKPDSDRARIVCCSVSDGKETIAFPWRGRVVTAMFNLLCSKVPKIASNMKFEERWSARFLMCHVQNWALDTMLCSHVLDNRPDITSIKFQSFVQLGQPEYDSHVSPYLKSAKRGGYEENKIKDCDLQDLMLYCGLDSLLEWHVARKQWSQLK